MLNREAIYSLWPSLTAKGDWTEGITGAQQIFSERGGRKYTLEVEKRF